MKIRWILAAVALAGAAAAVAWRLQPAPLRVAVAAVDEGRVETTVANTRAGSVAACRRAKLALPQGGRIERLAVKEGDRVKKGQFLLELWNQDLASREQVSREQVSSARAKSTEVCQTAANAAREAGRARQLRDKGFVSEESVERAESVARAQAAACQSARSSVDEAVARVGASRADTARTIMRAPFDGIVAEVNGEVGEYLTPSPPGIPTLPAVDLIDDSCLYVTAPIDEVDAARLKVGLPARITLDAFRGKNFEGRVRRIAPYVLALEKQARTVEVEVAFDAPEKAGHLLVGYSADVEVVVEARDRVPRIPTPALMPGGRVLVLGNDGRLEERKVTPGLANWEFTEVAQGLARGDRVVTSLERAGVKAGVKAVEDSAAPPKP